MSNNERIVEFWKPSTWGVRYGWQGHRGLDRPCGNHTSIPAIDDFVVTATGFSLAFGYWLEYRTKPGVYFTHPHLLNSSRLFKGVKGKAGQVIGESANGSDQPGTTWRGSHAHISRASKSGAYINGGTVVSPEASVRRAVAKAEVELTFEDYGRKASTASLLIWVPRVLKDHSRLTDLGLKLKKQVKK